MADRFPGKMLNNISQYMSAKMSIDMHDGISGQH